MNDSYTVNIFLNGRQTQNNCYLLLISTAFPLRHEAPFENNESLRHVFDFIAKLGWVF